MMIVTDIVEYSKSKYKVYVDGEFAFVLYKGELRQFKIEIEKELGIEEYNTITGEVLTKRAKLRAMHLLEKRPYTEYGMRTKLKESMYGDDIIDLAIDYLKSYKYIDDHSYAIQYIETYSSSKSIRRLKQDLMIKGVNGSLVDSALEECAKNGEIGDEGEMIRNILRKRGFGQGEITSKEVAKTANYLMGKGFSSDKIRYEMRNYINEEY